MNRTAREYGRVSKGKGRTARSITDQHADNLLAEQAHGPWTWGTAYADTGSASKYARKTRDDFDRMLSDLRSGEFGQPGDVLVLWEISRLSRETGKGVELIDAAENGGYLVHVTSHGEDYGRTYDPRNYSDRHALISGINDAEKEARLLSARTLRGVNSAAREGRPHGETQFGYAREYELSDGRPRPVRQFPHPVEGPLIRELFDRVAGVGRELPETMYSIAKDWRARGIVSRDGRPFSQQSLRSMLLRPAYAGLRKNHGVLVPATWEGWEPLIPRELFDRVQALLAEPNRRTYKSDGIKHVFTTTLRCDPCGAPMIVRYSRGRSAGYECYGTGCVRVDKAETDKLLTGLIVAYLSQPEVYVSVSSGVDDGEVTAHAGELSSRRAALAVLESAPTPRTPRAMLARTADMESLELEIEALERASRRPAAPAPLADLFEPGPDVEARWERTPVARQRAIAALLFTPAILGEMRITRTPRPGVLVPVGERLVVRRSD
jgi:DNA invertase Pin-like site-specific DNA recombinase